jgi:hypothetical protein
MSVPDGIRPLGCEVSIRETASVAGYFISNIDSACTVNDESTCSSRGYVCVVRSIAVGIGDAPNKHIVDASIEKTAGIVVLRFDRHDDVPSARHVYASFSIDFGSIPDHFTRSESIVRPIDVYAGCSVSFDLEIGEAAIRPLRVEAIYAVVEGIEVIKEEHVVELVDMNAIS